MSDRVNLLRRVESLDVAPQFTNYSKVRILLGQNDSGEDVVYEAGDDYGQTLEIENPFGTQAMANRILQKLRGFQYQPFKASGTLLDPSVEIGDGVGVKNIYGGVYNREKDFSGLMKTDIEAPHDEEIDHEYKYETSQERKYRREVSGVRATLRIQGDQIAAEVTQRQADSAEFRGQFQVQATQIAAKVSQTGGNNASFGWSLKATEFGLYAGNTKVFWVNSTGAHVKGEITATSGKIGNFNIGATAIWNNISKYGGTQTTGVYLGTDGIQLGQRFKVDTSGNVTASNLTLNGGSINLGNGVFKVTSAGAVTASNLSITGGSIKLGGTASAPVFQVTSAGAVTASNLAITGGRISIGNNFTVDSNGNLTANTGSFRGNVSAGKIQYGQVGSVNYGTFSGSGLTDYSIGSGKYGVGSVYGGVDNYGNPTGSLAAYTVAYGNSGYTGTLDQVGTNASNIRALSSRIATVEAGYFNSISTNSIAMGNYYFYVADGYVRAASID